MGYRGVVLAAARTQLLTWQGPTAISGVRAGAVDGNTDRRGHRSGRTDRSAGRGARDDGHLRRLAPRGPRAVGRPPSAAARRRRPGADAAGRAGSVVSAHL